MDICHDWFDIFNMEYLVFPNTVLRGSILSLTDFDWMREKVTATDIQEQVIM